MIIEINYAHGYMRINVEQFLENRWGKRKKLYRLISQHCEPGIFERLYEFLGEKVDDEKRCLHKLNRDKPFREEQSKKYLVDASQYKTMYSGMGKREKGKADVRKHYYRSLRRSKYILLDAERERKKTLLALERYQKAKDEVEEIQKGERACM